MKISFAVYGISRLPCGGVKVILEYANYLSHKGHDVSLYVSTAQYGKDLHLPEFIGGIIGRICIRIFPQWFDLDDRIKKIAVDSFDNDVFSSADCVIATEVRTAKAVFELSQDKGRKFYLIQGFENWLLPENEVISTYKLGMTNITISKWLKSIVETYSGRPAVYISNSINTEIFKIINPVENRMKHSICFHFRRAENKGGNDAIDVIKMLHDKYDDLQVFVVSVENKPLSMPRYVHYQKGITPAQVAQVNNQCAVFMCSSIEEGFGLPGLEAMACGCALATTNYQGALEYTEEGINALVSPVHDPKALFHNVCRLFDDDSLRIRIAKNGISTALSRSLDKAGEKFENLLLSQDKK